MQSTDLPRSLENCGLASNRKLKRQRVQILVERYTARAKPVFWFDSCRTSAKTPDNLAEPASDFILRCLRSRLNIGAKFLGDKEYSADRMVQSSAAGEPIYTLSHPKHMHLHVMASNIPS